MVYDNQKEKCRRNITFMTVQQAYKIFDVRSDITKMELKKRYRRLMHMVHPDAVLNRDKSNKENVYRYSAYEINEAYTVLFNQTGQESLKSNYKYDYKYSEYDEKYYGTDQENEEYDFTAPENEHAFCQRNVYHYAEDYNGNNIGRFKVARGRYMWMPDEDFKLFLRSIYECSEELLNRIDEETGRVHDSEYKIIYQAELAYLLAQQFTQHQIHWEIFLHQLMMLQMYFMSEQCLKCHLNLDLSKLE